MPTNQYERWTSRFWDNAARLLGFALVVWEATKPSQSRDLLVVGVILLIAPDARLRIIRRIIGAEAERGDDT